MAGEGDRLKFLQGVLATMSEQALAALASPGLVRRARKDLETGASPEISGQDEQAVTVRVGECVVTIPLAGPAGAKCTCPAGTICRHILAATIYLKEHLPEESTGTADGAPQATGTEEPVAPPAASSSARDELLAITPAQLLKWARTKAVRDAGAMLDDGCKVEIQEGPSVVVRFPERGIECHYLAGAGLGGMITNAPSRDKARFLAAAVLAFQRDTGVRHEQAEAQASPARPTRSGWRQREVLAVVRCALVDCLCIGLSHVSDAMRQRLDALAVSAHGADMPRLAGLLRSLAEEVELLLDRNAQADEGRLFTTLCLTFALTEALLRADETSPQLLGRYQSQYEDFNELELLGVAAWPWRTKSGYDGLTLLLWQPQEQSWYTWSDSRPDHVGARFNPAERYRRPVPWQNGVPPERLCRSRFVLTDGRRNGQHRLSSSARCRLSLLGQAVPSKTDFGDRLFTDWSALARQAAKAFPIGLEQIDPSAGLVVLRPSRWGQKRYDEITQTFRWPVQDAAGRQIDLVLAYDDASAPAIDRLQRIQPRWHGVRAIVGHILFERAGIALQPYALFGKPPLQDEQAWNLHFDDLASRPGAIITRLLGGKMKSTMGPLPDEAHAAASAWSPQVERDLCALEDDLLHLAERGCRFVPAEVARRLLERTTHLADRGFGLLADCCRSLASPATVIDTEGSPQIAAVLARTRYTCLLHRQVSVRIALQNSEL